MSTNALDSATTGLLPEEPEPEQPRPVAGADAGFPAAPVQESDPIWTLGSLRTLGDRLR